MVVHHGGDAIEAVAVEFVLIHPPACVAEQEPQRLPVACTSESSSEHASKQAGNGNLPWSGNVPSLNIL